MKKISLLHRKKLFLSLLGGACIIALTFNHFWPSKSTPSYQKTSGSDAQVGGRIITAASLENPEIFMNAFLEKNKWDFDMPFMNFLMERKLGFRNKEQLSAKNIFVPSWFASSEEGGISLYYDAESLGKNGKRAVLWFPPYHFPGLNPAAVMLPKFKGSDISPIVVDINTAQLTAKDFSELSKKLSGKIDTFLKEKQLSSIDVLVTSMGTLWGLNWANENIDRVGKIILHTALVEKTDFSRVGFLNQYPSSLPKKDWSMQGVEPVNNIAPSDFFVGASIYHAAVYHQGYLPDSEEGWQKIRYISGVNYSLFLELWKKYEYDHFVRNMKNFSRLQEKTTCIITYDHDTISQKSDMISLANPATQIVITPGDHGTAWVKKEEFVKQIRTCEGN